MFCLVPLWSDVFLTAHLPTRATHVSQTSISRTILIHYLRTSYEQIEFPCRVPPLHVSMANLIFPTMSQKMWPIWSPCRLRGENRTLARHEHVRQNDRHPNKGGQRSTKKEYSFTSYRVRIGDDSPTGGVKMERSVKAPTPNTES